MIITLSDTVTLNAVLEAGVATSFAGKSNQFHVLLKNEDISKIITEELGNPFTIQDSTLTEPGFIDVDVAVELGYNRLVLYFADDADLDSGSTTIIKIGSGFARRVVDETILTV